MFAEYTKLKNASDKWMKQTFLLIATDGLMRKEYSDPQKRQALKDQHGLADLTYKYNGNDTAELTMEGLDDSVQAAIQFLKVTPTFLLARVVQWCSHYFCRQ